MPARRPSIRKSKRAQPRVGPVKSSRAQTRRSAPKSTTRAASEGSRIEIENVNHPGYKHTVDATKYGAMKKALLRVLPRRGPGLTQAEMGAAVVEHLPEDLFPGGAKAEWWAKTVQLDLEAKRVIVRDTQTRPLRWRRG